MTAAYRPSSRSDPIKFVKTNFLPGRTFVDDDDLVAQSAAWCAQKNGEVSQAHRQIPRELLAEERKAFDPLRTTAATYGLYRVATVNRESLVRVDGNQYSIPTGHLGQAVDVRLLATDVVLSRDGVELARHARCTGRYLVFQMAEVAVPRELFRGILNRIADLRPPVTVRC